MIFRKGIARNTFLFTACIITLAVLVSSGFLYAVLPGYYLHVKTRRMKTSSETLAKALREASGEEACGELIAGFIISNNAEVFAFDENDDVIVALSNPYVVLNVSDEISYKYEGLAISQYTIRAKVIIDPDEEVKLSNTIQDENKVYVSERVAEDSAESREPILISMTESPGMKWIVSGFSTMNRNAAIALVKYEIGNGQIDYITVSGTLQPIDEARSVILSLMPYLLAADIVIALLAAYFYSRRLTRPIVAISDAASQMRASVPDTDKGVLSNVQTDDELGLLSQNLDELYTALCENIENARRETERARRLEQSKTDFFRAAGHELKTPITGLSGMLDGMIDKVGVYRDRDKYLLEAKKQTERLTRLVGEILQAAQWDEADSTVETVDTGAMFREVTAEYQWLIDERHLRYSVEDFHCVLETEPRLLRTVFSNLISNAARHTPEGGFVRISASATVLSIENQCDPIPEGDLSRLFEPFHSQTGAGLGLYIVRKHLERLGFAYRLTNTEHGLRFEIDIEAAHS